MATKGYIKSKKLKFKMEMWKRNSSPALQLFTYKEPRKNVLKINLLLLWTIFSFFIGLFKFLVIIS